MKREGECENAKVLWWKGRAELGPWLGVDGDFLEVGRGATF